MKKHSISRTRRGFTLIELVLAGVVAALVLVTIVSTLSQVGRARAISRTRLQAYLRADSALDAVRRDLSSVLRDADLFHTRVLQVGPHPIGACKETSLPNPSSCENASFMSRPRSFHFRMALRETT